MAPKRKSAEAPEPKKIRVHVGLDPSLRRRLGAYAGHHGYTESQVIESALVERLKGFFVGQRNETGASVAIDRDPRE